MLELFSRQKTIIATIVAKTDVSILRIPADELYLFAMNDLPLLRKISCHIANDLYRDSGLNGKLFYLSGLERVRFYLTDYFQKNAYSQPYVVVRQSYQTIANHIGVSQRTVVRAIRDLREHGLRTMSGKHIRISQEQFEGIKRWDPMFESTPNHNRVDWPALQTIRRSGAGSIKSPIRLIKSLSTDVSIFEYACIFVII